jgi:hypothetical protein
MKSGTMSSHKSENEAKKTTQICNFGEMMAVIKGVEGGQSRPIVRRDLKYVFFHCNMIMKNVDEIKKTIETARRKTAATLRYSLGLVFRTFSLIVG